MIRVVKYRPGFENDEDTNSSKRRKRGSIFFRKRKVRRIAFFFMAFLIEWLFIDVNK